MFRGMAKSDSQSFTFVTETGNTLNTTEQLALQEALASIEQD
jgi:hypothetical protein